MQKKSKKKTTPLSSVMKAFCIAGHFPAKTPSEFRALLPGFKQRYQSLLSSLHYTPPEPVVVRTADNYKFLDMLIDKDNFDEYASASRDFILGYWLSHKRIYKINADTIDFLDNEFHIEQCNIDFSRFYQQLCNETIYLEFPNNAPATGAFCGCLPFISQRFTTADGIRPLATSIIQGNTTMMNILYAPYCNLQQCIEESPKDSPYNAAENLICKAIAYIAYINDMNDSLGTTLIEVPQPYSCYEVHPIPFKDSLIDFSTPNGWIQSGLCNYFSYLSRQHMVSDFIAALKKLSPSDFILKDVKPPLTELNPLIMHSVLSWEENKVIYQYSKDVSVSLTALYGENLLNAGVSSRLVQYMPYPTIILFDSSLESTSMISLCQINEVGPALFLDLIEKGDQSISIIPLDDSPIGKLGPNALIPPPLYTVLCAYIHILSVQEKRTLKKIRANTCPIDSPAIQQPSNSAVQTPNADIRTPPILRIGEVLDEEFQLLLTPSTSLFELTPRTIKVIPKKEIATRCGFRMPPHIRGAHPHNYWVGRGEARHLEVRYLKSIKVNAEKKDFMPTTVIRNIT